MNIYRLVKNLNDRQFKAVTAIRTNLLVLAGAGSGKTSVIVHRIAWLQNMKNYSPNAIMVVTFTNKAATELRNRITQLIGNKLQHNIWIGTFHSIAHKILRTHYIDALLPRNFQILDQEDQLSLLKQLIKKMDLDEKKWTARQAMFYINNKKDKGIRPCNILTLNDFAERIWENIYQEYQNTCNRSGLVDFSELLLRTHELWIHKPNILKYYNEQFKDILIDEFQDTNTIQYTWIRLLAKKECKVMIVGDDDQSIYGWRGAKSTNIQNFINDFSNTQIIILEQNYRSTNNILIAANALIANNNKRLYKNLWTKGIKGELITLYCASNELDEAYFVISNIENWIKNGGKLAECAILYRNNFQSRVFEEALIRANIMYRVHGGVRFFEREEIKDVISYLRLIINHNDDAAFERVINKPTRGIGNTTLNVIRQMAYNYNLSLWKASKKVLQKQILTKRLTDKLKDFHELIELLKNKANKFSLYYFINHVIKESGLWIMYQSEITKQRRNRAENLKELIIAIKQFHDKNNEEKENLIIIQNFVYSVTLDLNEEFDNTKDTVHLMTLHSSKGLEFSQVFIVGMEENIFPNKASQDISSLLEEERRLAYVGITRAMHKLVLTYSKKRILYGKSVYHNPSRFIKEIPNRCIKIVNLPNNKILF